MMKELKNKEVLIGLVVIIILGSVALFLLVRRETGKTTAVPYQASNEEVEGSWYQEEDTDDAAHVVKSTEEGLSVEDTEYVVEESAPGQAENQASLQVKTDKAAQNILEKENLYSVLGDENYQQCTLVERKEDDGQLKELFGYWDDYKLEAVHDLLRLERIQAISAELDGTNKFYYYGEVDSLGRPSGKGLAVYGNNTYYCGEWKEGLRSGQGMWLQLAIYDESNVHQNLGVVEHIYNGSWSKDLPNGQGQEHFSYDFTILRQESRTIANVIGNFRDGYYHGDMYIMSTDNNGSTMDWNGTCKKGVWETVLEGSTSQGVWRGTEPNGEGDYAYHYMFPEENARQGVYGLKK